MASGKTQKRKLLCSLLIDEALQEPLRDGLEFCGRDGADGQGQHISRHDTICVGFVHGIVVACTSFA